MRIVIFGLRLGLGLGIAVSRHRGETAVLGGRTGSVLLCFPYISPCHITLLLAVSCRPSTVGAMTFADPQSSSGREPEALRREPEPSGDASVRAGPWKALTPAETEAFNARSRDRVRRVREAADDAAWRHYAERPFPGGPLTADLTSREAAELSGKLARGWQALWDTKPDPEEWYTPEADAHAGPTSRWTGSRAGREQVRSGSYASWAFLCCEALAGSAVADRPNGGVRSGRSLVGR